MMAWRYIRESANGSGFTTMTVTIKRWGINNLFSCTGRRPRVIHIFTWILKEKKDQKKKR
jgi:hypothetical protein